MHYQLKTQQLLTYSRIRMYRAFLERLAADQNVRTNGESHLFYFMMLCSRANFRTSRVSIDGIRYSVAPGEWLMPVKELASLFRCKTDKSTLSLLEEMQAENLIGFTPLHRSRYVKYKILHWNQYNTVIEDNASCTKEDGFFFFPYSMVNDFMGKGKCSEMDIVLDLWINAIYCDSNIAGSSDGPVVYFRNGSHSPLIGYDTLGTRWGISKSTTGRILRKLQELGYVELMAFPGKYGTAIYMKNYLPTMFDLPEMVIDREDVALSLHIDIPFSACQNEPEEAMDFPVSDTENMPVPACHNGEKSPVSEQIVVPENIRCVPKSHLVKIVREVVRALFLQDYACASCARARYILSNLSDDCKKKTIYTELVMECPSLKAYHCFSLEITPQPDGDDCPDRFPDRKDGDAGSP